MQDVAVILKELTDLKSMLSNNASSSAWPRWLSMTKACEYSSKSKNWLRERLEDGDIYGYRENPKGNWVIDKNSIDDYFLRLDSNTKSKLLDFKKRAGLS